MVITQTPFRMSFFGGGTDVREFFTGHGGAVLSTAIDKFCYVTVRHLPPFFEYRNEAAYSVIERTTTPSEFEHPVIREAMGLLDMHDLRITYEADLPARTGLGTSSSFAVGLLHAFHAIKGKTATPQRLAEEAIHIERDRCREAGGLQDQVAAAFGGFNRIDFANDGFTVTPVRAAPERLAALQGRLLLFFTGFSRLSANVQDALVTAIPSRIAQLERMKAMVGEAQAILEGAGDMDAFGELLDEGWQLKRTLSSRVTTNRIDDLYRRARAEGALGGKLLGSGAGGFLVFYADPDRQDAVRHALRGHMEVPFAFEPEGSRTLYCVPETYTKQD
jgi:D-glycero-alpha-D-manno-heptose-7-phosphate kinase